MHRIERLDPSTRSKIRSQVYSVLTQYASGGKHDQIYLKDVFLRVADGLVDRSIIDRPEWLGGSSAGGQRFSQFVEGRQPTVFPDYGISPEIAGLVRLTFWELYLQGVLAPATYQGKQENSFSRPDKNEDMFMYFDYFMITPYGVSILLDSTSRIQVHDPDGYLTNFMNASPQADVEMMRYLAESVKVFRAGYFLASVVLLGIASERLISIFAESLRDALKRSKGEATGNQWFNDKYKSKTISEKFRAIDGKLMGEYGSELATQDLKDAFQGLVTLTFEQIRHARNDIAHPQGREFTWNEVSGLLHSFVPYFRYINKIMEFLASKP